MSNYLFVFPGQGAQYRGIGRDLIDAYSSVREIYESASSVLGYDIVSVSCDNLSDKIHQTRFTQPALLTHAYACWSVFRELTQNRIIPAFACGHSLGEYGALVAAESLTFSAALALVSSRGRLMGQNGGGEMLALPLSEADLAPYLESSPCQIAACNLPEQTVIGGWPAELDELQGRLTAAFPTKAGVRLKTEGAFHTSHMRPAAEQFLEVLNQTEFSRPQLPAGANVTGKFHEDDVASIRNNLYLQLFAPVRWHENLMTAAASGVDAVIEFGGGLGEGSDPATKRPNLAGMIARAYRRVKPRPKYYAVINQSTLEATSAELLGK